MVPFRNGECALYGMRNSIIDVKHAEFPAQPNSSDPLQKIKAIMWFGLTAHINY
jgi:hypothetical protein